MLTLCASTRQKVYRCLYQQEMFPTVTQKKRGAHGDPEEQDVKDDPDAQKGAEDPVPRGVLNFDPEARAGKVPGR